MPQAKDTGNTPRRPFAARNEERPEGLLLGLVAHEMRSPLAVIRAYTSALLNKPHLLRDRETLEIVERIDATARDAQALLRDLQLLASLQSGAADLKVTPFEPCDFLRGALLDFQTLIPGRSIELDLGEESFEVLADQLRLREILLNLLENADKYSRPGAPIRIRTVHDWSVVTIMVEDAGPGVSDAELENIFRPFYRATTAAIQGSGLGLSLCRLLVGAQGGRIWAERIPDGGFRIAFSLPEIASESSLPAAA